MSIFRRLLFDLWYLRHPPWDTGLVPPEVEEFIHDHPPGRALDFGCGTGTSSLALARAGWRVTGVDFASRAIRIATRKARNENLTVELLVTGVTHLPASFFHNPFNLVLDIGCFHGLSQPEKDVYLTQLDRLLAIGGTWLLYGFSKPDGEWGVGLTPGDLRKIRLDLLKKMDGMDRMNRPSAWFWFKKA